MFKANAGFIEGDKVGRSGNVPPESLNWQMHFIVCIIPTHTRRPHNVGTMLGQRRRRWDIIVPTLCEVIVFAGIRLQ